MINQNLVNNDFKVERITTGTTHPYLGAIPAKGTIPLAETKTGTITTDNAGTSAGLIVLGVGTLFLTEIFPGDFLYDNDAAIRKVRYVFSDTLLELEEAFPASVSGIAVKRPKNQYYKEVLVYNTGAAAEVQESPIEDGERLILGGSPIAYDGTGSQLQFTCTK